MRVAVIHNRDTTGVINVFGMQNRERYNPKTVELVAAALESGGHNVRVFDGNMHVIDQLRDFMPRVLAGERPGMVFNMAYGIQGVSRYTHLPAMLEMLGVPYVGSGPQAHGLALDKVVAKMIFAAEGVPTPKFWNFSHPDQHFDDIEFPVIVKPKMEAVSYGIQIVHDPAALRAAVAQIIDEFGQHVLVEQFIPGREFAVGLLGNNPPDVLPIVEIDLEGDANAIQTADEKLKRPLRKLCPAPLSEEKAAELSQLAQRSFESLGLHDFARIDVRMDADENFHVLEINSMASLGLSGTYVNAAITAGYSYEGLINRMLDVAAVRYFGGNEPSSAVAGTPDAAVAPLPIRVRSHLRTSQSTTEDLLARMVDLRTPATNAERVDAFGDWLITQLRPLGFGVATSPDPETGTTLVFTNHPGERHDLMVLGHLDSASGPPFQRFVADGRWLRGSGVAEHKGGIAVLLGALRALRFTRSLRRTRLALVFVADDTLGGRRSGPIVQRIAAAADAVVGLKAAEPDGAVLTSRAGRSTYSIELTPDGRGAPTPTDAITTLCRRVISAERLRAGDPDVRVAVTGLDVDAPFGQLPDTASTTVTVRFRHPEAGGELDAEVRKLFKRAPVGLSFTVRGGIRRPPLVAGPATSDLYDRVATVAASINVPMSAAHRWHSSSICQIPVGMAALDGLGPIGFGERTADERILRSSLVDRSAVLALVVAGAGSGRE
ncbi:MAG: M20/M25/M40 family metallo-hydrolase [Acidimicrobiales bacterium]|nr:M20/M25/M40 family metallo-hydrolase [Acidimicrobiales bacterium]